MTIEPTTEAEEILARALHDGQERPDGRRRPRVKAITDHVEDEAQQLNMLETAYQQGGNRGGIIGLLASATPQELEAIRSLLGVSAPSGEAIKRHEASVSTNVRAIADATRKAHAQEPQRTFMAYNAQNPREKSITLDIQDVKYEIPYGRQVTMPETVFHILIEMGRAQPQTAEDAKHLISESPEIQEARQRATMGIQDAQRTLSPFLAQGHDISPIALHTGYEYAGSFAG